MTAAYPTRAMVLDPYGQLVSRQLSLRAPRGTEVLIQMRAAGVCGSDLHLVDGDWATEEAVVPGHEAAGVVTAVGDSVADLEVGDHVVVSWFPHCGDCASCHRGDVWACQGTQASSNRLPDGSTPFVTDTSAAVYPFIGVGAFSEYAVVPETAAIKVPRELPFEIGALIGCSVATGVGAVTNTVQVQPGDTALVMGCGGVGLATVAGLKLAGASRIIAVDLSAERLAAATAAGATHAIMANDSDFDRSVAEAAPEGIDYAFEAIGRVDTILRALDLVRPGGTLVLEGLTATGVSLPIDAYSFTESGKRLVGCNYGSSVPHRDFPELARLYLTGALALDDFIGQRIGLDDVPQAFAALRQGQGGRSVVVFDTGTADG